MFDYQHLDFSNNKKIDLPHGKIVCVGRNYMAHINELNNEVPSEPLLFIKPSTSLCLMGKPIRIPQHLGPCHNELEIAVLIQNPLSHCSTEQAKDAIWGIGLGLDLTLRQIQGQLKKQGHPWERAKAFDGSCPMSPFIPVRNIANLSNVGFSLEVNCKLRQQGNSQDMIVNILDLLIEISNVFTLLPGDIVMTGTPKGVSALCDGDSLRIELDGHFNLTGTVEIA